MNRFLPDKKSAYYYLHYILIATLFWVTPIGFAQVPPSRKCLVLSSTPYPSIEKTHIIIATAKEIMQQFKSRELYDPESRATISFVPKVNWEHQTVSILKTNGEMIGTMLFSFKNARTLVVDSIDVLPRYRKQGVNLLMAAIVILRYPETRNIETLLIDLNYSVFRHSLVAGNNMIQALTQTPFYRVFRKLGFQEIDPMSATTQKNQSIHLYLRYR